ncbi:hypothetical protein ACS0TY_003929 [Phlomoides rotata]
MGRESGQSRGERERGQRREIEQRRESEVGKVRNSSSPKNFSVLQLHDSLHATSSFLYFKLFES